MRRLALLFALTWASVAVAEDVPAPTTPFPTVEWREMERSDPLRLNLEAIVAKAFEGSRPDSLARSRALVVVVDGEIAAERYADGITRDTRLQSWSTAKSLLHAALGIAAGDGLIDADKPAAVPEWREAGDPRAAITLRHLMTMTDGLAFHENYGDTNSEVMQMLFGAGRGDVGALAAAIPPAHEPGTYFSYSSGSGNILSRVLRDALGGREAYARFLRERLFAPLGMRSAIAEFDASGTWIASSYVHATARDFARFGLFYLQDGVWDGRQILPVGWAKRGCSPTTASRGFYGELFWLNAPDPETGVFPVSPNLPATLCFARGFGGQLIAIIPSHDAVIVMMNSAYSDEVQPIIDLMAAVVATIGKRPIAPLVSSVSPTP